MKTNDHIIRNKFSNIVNCPCCDSTNLLQFEQETFCNSCEWDSLRVSVESGSLDYLTVLDLNAIEGVTGEQIRIVIPSKIAG